LSRNHCTNASVGDGGGDDEGGEGSVDDDSDDVNEGDETSRCEPPSLSVTSRLFVLVLVLDEVISSRDRVTARKAMAPVSHDVRVAGVMRDENGIFVCWVSCDLFFARNGMME
jgi:hypothetical protein